MEESKDHFLQQSISISDPFLTSAKIRALLDDLQRIHAPSPKGSRKMKIPKSVIFSQWTCMLDLLATSIKSIGLKFVRLDGKMTREFRTEALEALNKDPNVTIILVSLKAGGVGLNLTAANRVYIMVSLCYFYCLFFPFFFKND